MSYKIRITKNVLYDYALIVLVLYNLFFTHSYITKLFNMPEYGYRIVWILCILLLCFKIRYTKFTKTETIKVIILLLIGLFVTTSTRDDSTLTFAIFCVASKDIDYRNTFKKVYIAILVGIVLISMMALLGIIDNKSEIGNTIWENRTYLGFRHPNYCGSYLLDLALLWFVCVSGKLQKRDMGIILLTLGVNFLGPKTKTALLIEVFLLVVYFIHRYTKKTTIKKILNKVKWLPIVLILIIIIMIYQYNAGNSILLNEMLTGRIAQMSHYFSQYRITLLGQGLEQVSYRMVTEASQIRILDNGFLYMLLGKGILFFGMYWYLFVNSIHRFIKEKSYDLVIVLSMVAIWGFTETYLYRVDMAPIIILLSSGLYKNPQSKVDVKEIILN